MANPRIWDGAIHNLPAEDRQQFDGSGTRPGLGLGRRPRQGKSGAPADAPQIVFPRNGESDVVILGKPLRK
jgi:hypothetical protein